jgi:hypothetical protein
MSYAFLTVSNPTFSRNQLAGITLNPTQMSETQGIGTTDPTKLDPLRDQSGAFRYDVDTATGKIDWDRDGWKNPSTVRAAPTWGWGGGGGCEHGTYQGDLNGNLDRSYSALSWFLWDATPQQYWFTRRNSDGAIEYRYATSFPENCGSPAPPSCLTNWNPGISTTGTVLSGSTGSTGAPAAASYFKSGGQPVMLVAYKDATSHLKYQTLRVNCHFIGGQWLCSQVWSSVAAVGSGSEVVNGDPAAVAFNGEIFIYAVVGTGTSARLKEWRYTTTGTWVGPVDQVWAGSGSPITPSLGVGVAQGYVKFAGSPVLVLVTAIPETTPAGLIDIAYRSTPGQWVPMGSDRWPVSGVRAYTQGQPGLAYEPFNRGVSTTEGRYYLAWNPDNGDAVYMTETVGNDWDSPDVRRMRVSQANPVYYSNMWATARPGTNLTLLYDLSYDNNMRLSYTYRDSKTGKLLVPFAPVADGIFNGNLKDQNDYPVIGGNLACAIKGGTCPF